MVPGVSMHPIQHAELVDVLCNFWKELRDPQSARSVLAEFKDGSRVLLLTGLWLVVEGVEMSGSAGHAEEDDSLGTGRQGSSLGAERGFCRGRFSLRAAKGIQGKIAKPAGCRA